MPKWAILYYIKNLFALPQHVTVDFPDPITLHRSDFETQSRLRRGLGECWEVCFAPLQKSARFQFGIHCPTVRVGNLADCPLGIVPYNIMQNVAGRILGLSPRNLGEGLWTRDRRCVIRGVSPRTAPRVFNLRSRVSALLIVARGRGNTCVMLTVTGREGARHPA